MERSALANARRRKQGDYAGCHNQEGVGAGGSASCGGDTVARRRATPIREKRSPRQDVTRSLFHCSLRIRWWPFKTAPIFSPLRRRVERRTDGDGQVYVFVGLHVQYDDGEQTQQYEARNFKPINHVRKLQTLCGLSCKMVDERNQTATGRRQVVTRVDVFTAEAVTFT